MGKQVDRWVLLLVEKIFSFFPTSTPLPPSANMADSHIYVSKPSHQVTDDVQVATRSGVPAPIVLEILDDSKQLTAKIKQQQAELKKATDALEHEQESKRKAAEEVAEREHEKKAACEMDEMA